MIQSIPFPVQKQATDNNVTATAFLADKILNELNCVNFVVVSVDASNRLDFKLMSVLAKTKA